MGGDVGGTFDGKNGKRQKKENLSNSRGGYKVTLRLEDIHFLPLNARKTIKISAI